NVQGDHAVAYQRTFGGIHQPCFGAGLVILDSARLSGGELFQLLGRGDVRDVHRGLVRDSRLALGQFLTLRSLFAVWQAAQEIFVEWIPLDEMLPLNEVVRLFGDPWVISG